MMGLEFLHASIVERGPVRRQGQRSPQGVARNGRGDNMDEWGALCRISFFVDNVDG
jgi:hypothetical protein